MIIWCIYNYILYDILFCMQKCEQNVLEALAARNLLIMQVIEAINHHKPSLIEANSNRSQNWENLKEGEFPGIPFKTPSFGVNDLIQQDSTSVKVKIMTDMTGQQHCSGLWNSSRVSGIPPKPVDEMVRVFDTSRWHRLDADALEMSRWPTNLPCAMEWCMGMMYSDTVYDDWVIDWHSIWKSFWINRSSDHSVIGHFFKSHPVDGVLSFVFLGFFQVNASNISQKESLNLEPSQFARVQKESAGENQMQTVREY